MDIETNFFLTTKGLSHHFTLKEKPFTLIIESQKTPIDIYLNGKLIIANQLDSLTILSNLPSGMHAIGVFHSHERFFYQSFHSKNRSQVFIKASPFYHYHQTLILASLLGLVPGLNYFIHFPRSTAGIVIPNLVLHYFFAIGYILQSTGISFFDEQSRLPLNAETIRNNLLVGMVFTSLLHSLFSFLGTKRYLDNIRERHQAKITWGVKMDIEKFSYGIHFHYRIK